MTIQNINVKNSIEDIKKLLEKEKVSPALKAAIELILLLIKILTAPKKTSKNSSLPPSQDPNRSKESKKNSGKKPGGQKEREGKTLELYPESEVDEIIEIPVKIEEFSGNKNTWEFKGYQEKQVLEIEITRKITSYKAEIWENEKGEQIIGKFPPGIKQTVQYGKGIKAHAVYLNSYQLLPYQRIQEYFEQVAGIELSVGTLCNWQKKAGKLLEKIEFEAKVKTELIESKLLYSDETGININSKNHWLHVAANEKWSYLKVHKKRGTEAIDSMEILPKYKGLLVHDFWKSYYKYKNIQHVICNAHILRELEYFSRGNTMKTWAKSMKNLLIEMVTEKRKNAGIFTEESQICWKTKYQEILKKGKIESPENIKKEGAPPKRGRLKQTKDYNLWKRLSDYESDILRFLTDPDIPFTNNLGERELRMSKVQQKISGCFKSLDTSNNAMIIRSFLQSSKKHNIPIAEALNSLFLKKPFEQIFLP